MKNIINTSFLIGGDFDKYFVIKQDDFTKYTTSQDYENFSRILREIRSGRETEGKSNNYYLVINIDESYAPEIIEILKRNGHWGS